MKWTGILKTDIWQGFKKGAIVTVEEDSMVRGRFIVRLQPTTNICMIIHTDELKFNITRLDNTELAKLLWE